jgi:ABC-2 type transport system ATP-binding protein
MGSTVAVAGLVKRFGPTRALDGLDLVVRAGEVHGFLGPNGAGSPPPSASCSACCGPTGAGPGCSAATPGGTPSPSTAAWPMCPAT